MLSPDAVERLRLAIADADRTITEMLAGLSAQRGRRPGDLRLDKILGRPPDLVQRTLNARDGSRLELLYIAGLVDDTLILEGIMKPLMVSASFRRWDAGSLPMGAVQVAPTPTAIEQALLTGQAILGPGAGGRWYAVDVASPPQRTVDEPKVAQVIHGPHVGFIEDLTVNLALIRQFVRSPLLAVDTVTVGTVSPAVVAIVRVVGPSRPGVAVRVKQKLQAVNVSGVVDTSLLMGYLGAHALVPTVQYSERPDQVAAALLAGRVAVLLDRSPTVLLVPTALVHLLSTPGDYYQTAASATLARSVRYVAVAVTVLLPALYVGITTVNQPLVPLPLWLSFVRARLAIPFPVFIETILMQLAFDLVYEAGLQVPSSFGQTVSVVGALVIGQAAIMAGIASAPTLIAVAFAYLAQLLLPDQNLAMTLRVIRYPVLLMASVFGLIGVTATFAILLSWGASIRTYGMTYLTGMAPLRPWVLHDALARLPWGQSPERPRR